MAEKSKDILSITESTLDVDKMEIDDHESKSDDSSKYTNFTPSAFLGSFLPFIIINGYEFTTDNIQSMELSTGSFLPTINLIVTDTTGLFIDRHFPLDGHIIKVLIKSNNEKVYKPIRIDFDILNITPLSLKSDNNVSYNKFSIVGQMKIPDLYTEFCESFSDKTSYDTLMDLTQTLKIGFASNETKTDDKMTWINAFDTREKFIKDVTSNAYKDEKSFFTSYIDVYYALNFVNINTIFSEDTSIPDSEVYMLNDPNYLNPTEKDGGIMKAPLMLTNDLNYKGTTKFISNYRLTNNSGKIFLENGYKRYCQYYDVKKLEFVSEFVDPLTTEGSDKKIHLKGRYMGNKDGLNPEGLNEKYFKYKYLGKYYKGDTGNMHENYMYSNILNYQNIEEMNKIGLIVNLEGTDLSLHKYQYIPVFIFTRSQFFKQINDEKSKKDELVSNTYNKFLSGYYIITQIDYVYNYPGPMTQRLYLTRREFEGSY